MDLGRWLACGAALCALVACGGGAPTPATPAPSQPSTPPVGGYLAKIAPVSGDGQTVRQHERLALALTVRVSDALGNPMAGVTVQGGAALIVTGADGLATIIPADSAYFHVAGTQAVGARAYVGSLLSGYFDTEFRVNVLASPYDFDGLYRCQIDASSPGRVIEPLFTQMRITSSLATMDAASGSVNGVGTIVLVDSQGSTQVRYSGVMRLLDAPAGAVYIEGGVAQNIAGGRSSDDARFWGCSRL